jgi:hypothetical protein
LRIGRPHVAQQLPFKLRSIQENLRRDAPLARQAMSRALKGTKHRNGRIKTPDICTLLGLAPFTPHDLRRTAATMCGNLGLSESAISQCLDHQATKGEDGQPLPAITNKVYNLSVVGRVERKRCLTHGPSSCGASLGMFRLRTWSGCLRPDLKLHKWNFAAAPSKSAAAFCKT